MSVSGTWQGDPVKRACTGNGNFNHLPRVEIYERNMHRLCQIRVAQIIKDVLLHPFRISTFLVR